MSPQQVRKVWSLVSLALLYYALNSYLVTQGGQEIFGAKLVSESRVPAALIAVAICSVLLAASSAVGINYALTNDGVWANRIPLVGFDELDLSMLNAKIYQGFMLFSLSFLPAVSLIHFWQILDVAKLATTASPPVPLPDATIWSWSALTSRDNPADVCSAILDKDPFCSGKMTILPGLEPTILAIVTGIAVALTLWFWGLVLFRGFSSRDRVGPA